MVSKKTLEDSLGLAFASRHVVRRSEELLVCELRDSSTVGLSVAAVPRLNRRDKTCLWF